VRIAILETGKPPEGLEAEFGGYPKMFETLLAGGERQFETCEVTTGAYPAQGSFDALLITGSPAGAYDPLPWIAPLEAFLKANAVTPMVGICFGHQIMAQAFGGQVEKSDKGFAIGLHRYEVQAPEPWIDDAQAFSIPASHQDQVVGQPPGSRVIARSAFTPIAALAYDSIPAISFQGHPEFDPAFASALIENRRRTRFNDAKADAGLASLRAANDRLRVGRWITRFLDGTGARARF